MTSFYKNKSELYLDAAEALMKVAAGHYAVVPHTAYYSSLLLMEHKCYIVDKQTEADIRPIINNKQVDLHVGLTNYIKKQLQVSSKRDAYNDLRDFTKEIHDLKKLRVKADYKNENVTWDDSQKSLELATEINGILKNY